MTSYTWVGTGTTASPTSGDWNQSGDWSPNGVPTDASGDTVSLGGSTTYTVTVSAAETAASLSIADSKAVLDITSTGSLHDFGAFGGVGTTLVDGAVLETDGSLSGTGNITLKNGGTIDYVGGALDSNFSTIFGDGNGDKIILGTGKSSTLTGSIRNWQGSDQLVLQGVSLYSGPLLTGPAISYSGTTLTVVTSNNGAKSTVHFNVGTLPTGSSFVGNEVGSDLAITLCFGEGTRIAVPGGEVAVEDLAEGDLVLTASGEALPVRWLGRRVARAADAAYPEAVWPVRVRAGAFGAGLPSRDLMLSPMHAVFVDGHLIPIKALLNGRSIRQVPVASVRYFHVELDRHAVILAEGLPAESYLETGGRAAFENGGTNVMAHPEMARRAFLAGACAPFAETGAVVERARLALLRRLPELGLAPAPEAVLADVAERAAA